MAPIYDRMTVILGSEDEKWLGEPANDIGLKAKLKPFPSERMSAWPVGDVRNDTADLIERRAVQPSLI